MVMQFDGYVYDSDQWCEYCLPVSTDHRKVQWDGGEQDCPAHCNHCHRLLDYTLTTDGINYVLEKFREAVKEGPEEWNKIRDIEHCPDDYYKGSRSIEILRDWAEDLSSYGLEDWQETLVSRFLEITAEGADVEAIKAAWAEEDAAEADEDE